MRFVRPFRCSRRTLCRLWCRRSCPMAKRICLASLLAPKPQLVMTPRRCWASLILLTARMAGCKLALGCMFLLVLQRVDLCTLVRRVSRQPNDWYEPVTYEDMKILSYLGKVKEFPNELLEADKSSFPMNRGKRTEFVFRMWDDLPEYAQEWGTFLGFSKTTWDADQFPETQSSWYVVNSNAWPPICLLSLPLAHAIGML